MSKYNIRAIKKELMNYYGTAMTSGIPMAMMDLGKLEHLSDDELVELARQNGINIEEYNLDDYER